MDNIQSAMSSQPDDASPNLARAKLESEDASKSETPLTSTTSPGGNNGAARGDGPATPGADDTVSLKPGQLPLDSSATAPGSPRPRSKNDTLVIPNAGRMLPMPRKTGESTDRVAAYRRWLESRSKEDLIELILSMADRSSDPDATDRAKLQMSELSGAPSEGYQIPENLTYVRLPVLRKTPLNEPTPAWRIVLICLDQNNRPLGLQIDSEITVGRAVGDTTPDLDLTSFGAKSKGVSRIHARLCPSMHRLTLIDSGSSNGTFWNRLRIEAQAEQPLKEGDVIAFGRVNFLVKIVKSPDAREAKTLI